MKKFDIEFKTMMLLEQARFERRKVELEMQVRELESKHQLLEEERELERKMKRTALEKDDVRSDSTRDQDKSPFNWTPKKRNVSDWVKRIDHLLTPDQSTAHFEATPEVNRQSHFPRYRNSRDRSSSVEDCDVFPRADLRYNIGYSGNSNLLKLKLNNFDGNPLEWSEWSSMFLATLDQLPIPDSEKMSHLKTVLTGKASSAISGIGYSGHFYGAA